MRPNVFKFPQSKSAFYSATAITGHIVHIRDFLEHHLQLLLLRRICGVYAQERPLASSMSYTIITAIGERAQRRKSTSKKTSSVALSATVHYITCVFSNA